MDLLTDIVVGERVKHEVEVKYPNVVSWKDAGNGGKVSSGMWTMIYDEGFVRGNAGDVS